jgi:predicted negative regulator of RcsB-dependent stress response
MEKPYSAYANLALAGIYYQENDFQKGNLYLEKIQDNSFAAADKYKLLGDGWLKQKQIDQGILAYEKSLQINTGQIEPRAMLIQLYEIRNPQKAQKEREYLKYIESFYRDANGS